jgi:hypothetical protein
MNSVSFEQRLSDPSKKLRKKKEGFSSEEDARLREIVSQLGTQAWGAIADNLPGRTARQCRERWKLYLAPEVNNDGWTLDEEQKLLQTYFAMGPRWTLIANTFPNRTANNIKNKTKQCLRRMQKSFRVNDAPPVIAPSDFAAQPQMEPPPSE